MSLVEHGFDLGVRFGNLPDSNLIIRRLADNHRVLVASPDYLKQYGISTQPKDLEQHRCLVMERLGEPLNEVSQFNSTLTPIAADAFGDQLVQLLDAHATL
jgi:DNA-binding transcriptional LysR family regulator